MEPDENAPGVTWVPQACTLPAADRPRRAAEFDGLFADAVRGFERAEPARLRLDLQPSPQIAGRAAELMVAEAGCCSFFAFTLTAATDRLALEISVPAPYLGVLDALADRAAAAIGTAT